jgi:transcriptional regulator with XRE-family HTH domain
LSAYTQQLQNYMYHGAMTTTVEELERTLGRGARSIRIARKLTQNDVAEMANISIGAVQHLESGAGATTTTLVKVLRALDAETWLTTLEPPPAPFDPLQLLAQRETQAHTAKGPSRVRRPRTAKS